MVNDYNDLTRDLMAAIVDGASPEEIRKRALTIKERLTLEHVNQWRALMLVDQIVLNHAADAAWEQGLVRELVPWPVQPVASANPNVPAQRPAAPADKRERVVTIAREFSEKGVQVVKASEIAERLAQEGFEGSLRNLATAAGNVLARRDEWAILRPGEYILRAEHQERVPA